MLLAVPAWEAAREDVDRVVARAGGSGDGGVDPAWLRAGVQGLPPRSWWRARRPRSRRRSGCVLVDPVDEFNAARHVGNDSPSTRPPPTPERMEEFFEFLRERIATARKFGAAGRDYALFRTLYHCRAACRGGGIVGAGAICTSIGDRSARSTSASARAPRAPGRGRGGCRCSTGSI